MRRAVASFAVLVVVTVGLTVPEASAAIPQAITWKVDHQTKTITVSVRITLYPSCQTGKLLRSEALWKDLCEVTPEIAARVKSDILSVWNKGYRYKCYKLVFEVDVTVDNDASRFTVADDRVGVRIDKSSVNFRSYVNGVGNWTSAWDSPHPEDKVVPTNSAVNPTTWGYPPTWKTTTYAHEFGHILGLDDAYSGGKPRPGAPVDLMSKGGVTTIAQSTIDLLVKRSGMVRDADLTCDYKIDTMVEWYRFQALKCGGAEGTWDIRVSGVRPIGAAQLVATGRADVELEAQVAVSSSTLTGLWSASYRIDAVGIPVSVGGQKGTVTGDASFDIAAPNLVLRLKAVRTEGDFWSRNPYAALSGAAQAQLKDLDLPVENGRFC